MTRKSTLSLVRESKGKVEGPCFLVTWDIDSKDRVAVSRTQYFIFGRTYVKNGRRYDYPGYISRDGVQYIAQSAVLVVPVQLPDIVRFLESNAIDHEVDSFVRP